MTAKARLGEDQFQRDAIRLHKRCIARAIRCSRRAGEHLATAHWLQEHGDHDCDDLLAQVAAWQILARDWEARAEDVWAALNIHSQQDMDRYVRGIVARFPDLPPVPELQQLKAGTRERDAQPE
jgi:hypothetical protein